MSTIFQKINEKTFRELQSVLNNTMYQKFLEPLRTCSTTDRSDETVFDSIVKEAKKIQQVCDILKIEPIELKAQCDHELSDHEIISQIFEFENKGQVGSYSIHLNKLFIVEKNENGIVHLINLDGETVMIAETFLRLPSWDEVFKLRDNK